MDLENELPYFDEEPSIETETENVPPYPQTETTPVEKPVDQPPVAVKTQTPQKKLLKRKTVKAEVTPEMLLGPKGLTCLAQELEKFSAQGGTRAGNELAGLDSLMRIYTDWGAGLQPAFDVDTFAEKTSKLGADASVRDFLQNMNRK